MVEIDYQTVSVKQANSLAEALYKNVQLEVLIEQLKAKLATYEQNDDDTTTP